jgi:hypothetical protein
VQIPGQYDGNAKRPGVAQFPQVHILLKKGLETLKVELPDFEEEMISKGARDVNFLNESSWVRQSLAQCMLLCHTMQRHSVVHDVPMP